MKKTLIIIVVLVILAGAGFFLYGYLNQDKKPGGGSNSAGNNAANTLPYEEQVRLLVNKIKSDPEWDKAVRNEAQKYGDSYGDRLIVEAEYHLQKNNIDDLLAANYPFHIHNPELMNK